MVKKVALLGATGSIGSSFFSVFQEHRDKLSIRFATAHSNVDSMLELARSFDIPCLVITGIDNLARISHIRQANPQLSIYFGESEMLRLLSEEDYDLALNAISGSAGIRATFAIIQRGKTLALANKESLVMGGHLVKKLAAPDQIVPVDSEHSAIFQALGRHPHNELKKLIITASGGAFRDTPLEDFPKITPQMALKHPNWDMGAKVTLDSATMFNKALEVMEAHWLFDMPYEQIEAVIHPQSVIHSMVEFIDGSILGQMSHPDMRLPILYALSYPERWESNLVHTDVLDLAQLSFAPVDPKRYPLFFLGLDVAKTGGILPTVMNAAIEAATKLFLNNIVKFTDIPPVVEETIQSSNFIAEPTLEEIIHTNHYVYHSVLNKYNFQE